MDSVQSANIRWYERSIKRRYSDALAEEMGEASQRDEPDALSIRTEVGIRVPDPGEEDSVPPSYIIRMTLKAEVKHADVTLDVAVRFDFEAGTDLGGTSESRVFAQSTGYQYVLGFVRSALADECRLVGLPAALIPINTLDEIRDLDLQPETSQ